VPLIEQTQQLPYSSEDADAIIGDDHFNVSCRSANPDVNLRAFGVIDGVLNISVKPVAQSPTHCPAAPRVRANVLHPDDIFRKTGLYGI